MLIAEKIKARPQTKIISRPHTTGSQIQCRFTGFPKASTKTSSSVIWISRCKQFPSTAEMGIISRGTGTRLMIDVLSVSELVPVADASVKKLNGTRPQSTKTGNPGVVLLGKILVNTNVNAPIITSGFNRDQNTPSDMLRYLILK